MFTTTPCRDCGGPLAQAFPTTDKYARCRACGHVQPIAHTDLGEYRVEYRLGAPGTYYSFLRSSTIVEARSRAAATASVKNGVDAEVLRWGPDDPELVTPTA